MPRTARAAKRDICYHVMNRGNNRTTIFYDDEDYRYFEALLSRAKKRLPMRVLAWCLMPNHFHLLCETPDDSPHKRPLRSSQDV